MIKNHNVFSVKKKKKQNIKRPFILLTRNTLCENSFFLIEKHQILLSDGNGRKGVKEKFE